jgi:hypothetical protein
MDGQDLGVYNVYQYSILQFVLKLFIEQQQ